MKIADLEVHGNLKNSNWPQANKFLAIDKRICAAVLATV